MVSGLRYSETVATMLNRYQQRRGFGANAMSPTLKVLVRPVPRTEPATSTSPTQTLTQDRAYLQALMTAASRSIARSCLLFPGVMSRVRTIVRQSVAHGAITARRR
jgi:hypothetical protein